MITFCIVVYLLRSVTMLFQTLWKWDGYSSPGRWLMSMCIDVVFIVVGCMALWQHLNIHVSIG